MALARRLTSAATHQHAARDGFGVVHGKASHMDKMSQFTTWQNIWHNLCRPWTHQLIDLPGFHAHHARLTLQFRVILLRLMVDSCKQIGVFIPTPEARVVNRACLHRLRFECVQLGKRSTVGYCL